MPTYICLPYFIPSAEIWHECCFVTTYTQLVMSHLHRILLLILLLLPFMPAFAGVSHANHHHSSGHHSGGHSSGHCGGGHHYYRSYGGHTRGYVSGGTREFRSNAFNFSVGLPLMKADVAQHYHQDQPDKLVNGVWMTDPTAAPLDAKVTTTRMSSCTVSFNLGFSVPIVKMTSNTQLAIEALAGVEFYHWNVGTIAYGNNTTAFDSAYTQNFNVPVSLNYVIGGEVDGHSPLTCTFGAGAAFSMTTSKYINSDTRIAYRPFVMAELGVLAGIPIKLRATAYMGSIKLIDQPTGSLYNAMEADGNIDGNIGVKMTGHGGVNLSLALVPGFHGRGK